MISLPILSIRSDLMSGYIGIGSPLWEYLPQECADFGQSTKNLRIAQDRLNEAGAAITRIMYAFKVTSTSQLPEGAKPEFLRWQAKVVQAQSVYNAACAAKFNAHETLRKAINSLVGSEVILG